MCVDAIQALLSDIINRTSIHVKKVMNCFFISKLFLGRFDSNFINRRYSKIRIKKTIKLNISHSVNLFSCFPVFDFHLFYSELFDNICLFQSIAMTLRVSSEIDQSVSWLFCP